MVIKKFLLETKNSDRDGYIWNMVGSMLMAFQSVIMLMILTRTLGLIEAGIFTIAFANANLFLTVGKYGMRYFQVSDTKKQFSFQEYRVSRIITTIAMLIISVGYIFYSATTYEYSMHKTAIIIWMCLFKAVDALEDVYNGLYQSKGRLDVATKELSLRMIITIIVFGVGLIVFSDLLIALIVATLVTIFLFAFFTILTYGSFSIPQITVRYKNIITLLKTCFPLFAGSFLSFYIGNAPKYAIDASLSEEQQACYGFIAMPVFVIGLLNNFIFNPMLYKLSRLWSERKTKQFVVKILRQSFIVILITAVCILGAWICGIPILSVLYNTDLAPYKTELLILLLGGGFLGMSGLLNAVITIIRYQKYIVWGYALVAILAYLFSTRIVTVYGMFGASLLYTILMTILCVIFAIILIYGIIKETR